MEMQGNATEIDERNLLQLDALLSHGYGLSPQLVISKVEINVGMMAFLKTYPQNISCKSTAL